MNEHTPTEYVVDFGDRRSDQFVHLNMALIEQNGAKLCEEIVRCANCEHCYKERRDTLSGWVDVFVCGNPQWSTASLMPSHEVEPDGFCKWGEPGVSE